ncbi:MAG TPA: tetratricopeptide repeat protein, partial [Planctomycetota bacterium]|nr:tetratricopeptide repeat protein [Planctomycetota bacterium]
TRCLEGEAPLGRFIRAQVPRVEIAMSVCNGAFSLAEAGFLDGLDVTTHSSALGWLRSAAPTARVHDDLRFCDNGHIVTAAGVSAGIDGALHLVHRLLGSAVARKAARRMEYVWADAPTEPTEPTSRADRARLAWYDGKWAVAEVDYRAIVAERPDDVVARTRLGTCLLFTGKGDEALAMLEGAARAGSEDPCLHHALGLALGRAGRHAEAVAALAHALEIDPSSMELRNSLGIAQADAGSHREAIENLRISFHYGVGDARTRVRIARSQVAIGDAAGALRTLEPLDDSGNRELATMLDDPAFDVVRGDPRFAAVVARVSR